MATVAEQVSAARKSVLLVFDGEFSVICVTGADRASWLNGLLTCDVLRLQDGRAEYGLAVTQKGRIITDLFVVARGDRLFVVLPARVRDSFAEMLDRHLIMEDAEIAKDDSLRVAFAHGPASATLLADNAAHGALCDRSGLGGALFLLGDDAARRALEESARSIGGVIGDEAGWEALRLERGIPRFAVDFDDKTYPQEAALEKRAVAFDKGCYLGQEVVCMLELRGHVKRKLVAVVLDGATGAQAGTPVLDAAGSEVGTLSSVGLSPTLSCRVGLAMVKLASAAPGTVLRVGGGAARVVERPV